MEEDKGWENLPISSIIVDARDAAEYATHDQRAFFPVVNLDTCTNCLFCWMYCPDCAIQIDYGKFAGFDLEQCQGCGVCAEVCPTQCITMQAENEVAGKPSLT